MIILKHRVNTINEIDKNFGLEIDVRENNGKLVLSHDNSTNEIVPLDNFLRYVDVNQLIAINIKSSEIESELKRTLTNSNLKNYFTFDWSIPSLIKATTFDLVCAFRLSEYEKTIIPHCDWVWIDSFHSIWYGEEVLNDLKTNNLKIAIVSPELHKRDFEIDKVKKIIKNGLVDAICTDYPERWDK